MTPEPGKRAARACSSCNRQKLRCDGQQPCSRCVDASAECMYLPSLRGKTRKKRARTDEHPKPSQTQTQTPGQTQALSQTADPQWQHWQRTEGLSAGAGFTVSSFWGDKPKSVSPPKSIPQKLTSLPLPGDAHNPLALLAEASATTDHDPFSPLADARDKTDYYAPSERELKDEAPKIMTFINVHEAEQLFDMYYRYLHPQLPVLDQPHSSPLAVARRSNYLFNAICCVAARASNIVLWERLKDFARFEMERIPKEKNIEVVQGHLLYANWNLIRPKNFEQDLTWIRAGIAVRTAMDINLHRIATVKQAKEGLPPWLLRSIVRTWLMSYVIDRTLSAQLGKPSSMRGESSVGSYVELILEGAPTADDLWVAAASASEWTQILERAMDAFRLETSLGNSALHTLVHVFNKQFCQWRDKWSARVGAAADGSKLPIAGVIELYHHYATLVMHSFGLSRAGLDLPSTFAQYIIAAMRVINTFEASFEGPGLTRGCPDLIFTALTYAAVSLLKATQPQFSHFEADRNAIFVACRKAADMLARAATTAEHLPASQSVFLSHLIAARQTVRQAPTTILEPIDFEAFGQSILDDQTRTLWPPTDPTLNFDAVEPPQQYTLPTALGLGETDQDLLFTLDSFWKSLLEGTPVSS